MQKPNKLPALTGIRFFLFFSVYCAHCSLACATAEQRSFVDAHFNGAYGVACFFLLSAFGIALGYGERFSVRPTARQWLDFMKRRLTKLYPIYLCTTLAVFAHQARVLVSNGAQPGEWPSLWKALAVHALLLQSVLQQYSHSLNAAAWFLSCLFILYLVMPWLLWVLSPLRKKPILSTMGIGICVLAMVAIRMTIQTRSDYMSAVNATYVTPAFRVFYVIIGILAVNLYRSLAQMLQDKPTGAADTLWEFFVLALAFLGYEYMHWQQEYLAYVPLFLLMIFTLALGRGAISRLLSLPIFQRLGDLSMECYLLHYPILQFVAGAVRRHLWPDISPVLLSMLLLVLTLGCAGVFRSLWTRITRFFAAKKVV